MGNDLKAKQRQLVTWTDLVVLKMSLVTLFCTFWSLERRYLGQVATVLASVMSEPFCGTEST